MQKYSCFLLVMKKSNEMKHTYGTKKIQKKIFTINNTKCEFEKKNTNPPMYNNYRNIT